MFIDFQRVLEFVGAELEFGVPSTSITYNASNLFLNHYLVKVLREVPKVNMLNEEYIVKTYFEILYIGDEGKSSDIDSIAMVLTTHKGSLIYMTEYYKC